MSKAAACPVSYESVDHNASRVTCILTIVALAAISAMAVLWPGLGRIALILAAALTLDYAIRAWTKYPSPMQWLARRFARAVGIAEKRSDAAPKRFACRIGFFFALGIVGLLPFAPVAAALVAAALLFFNVLDGVFDFCVGCWMYTTFLLPRTTNS
ncbi:MAG TPA: DUF4395 family protein [Thermoanaerobaculia bacterium]|jgi:predicted membrane channel-forming protein YqfA (hemolysin III family)|nr:DUF4395 family protein [Thermoanaerobaculia bacterium]